MIYKKLINAIILISFSFTASATEHLVEQKDKAFTKTEITIKVGDTIKFRNADPYNHNIFSLSDLKMFDLGSFPHGESRNVVFDKVGEAEVECAIHPSMLLKVKVTE